MYLQYKSVLSVQHSSYLDTIFGSKLFTLAALVEERMVLPDNTLQHAVTHCNTLQLPWRR